MLKDKILSASGGGVDPLYVDDVFSTWLYTGNGSTQTINNGIDLAGKGGLVWEKPRSLSNNHVLVDTARGAQLFISSNTTAAQAGTGVGYTFTNSGYVGNSWSNGVTVASWTFREAEKFFDVVTYTGNGVNRTIPHNLGSVPGCIIVKRTDTTSNWQVYHRGLTSAANSIQLNLTNAQASATTVWNSTAPTSTVFSVGTDATVNASGGTYVAYLFAHDAGGFGATGNDNVISCGSFTTDSIGSGSATLGFEPQWLLLKQPSGTGGSWIMFDVMRGMPVTTGAAQLQASTTGVEVAIGGNVSPTATGFTTSGQLNSNATYIYIAIRRPMKPPTSGTQVFMPFTFAGNGATTSVTTNFPVDLMFDWTDFSNIFYWMDRLRGSFYFESNSASVEVLGNATNGDSAFNFANNTQAVLICPRSGGGNVNSNGQKQALYTVKRTPGFFDVACYTGTGNGQVINHNLGAVPELAIFKLRAGTGGADWVVRAPGTTTDRFLLLNTTAAQSTAANWYSATSTQITFPTAYAGTASSGFTYVAYLFASLPGISQVGTYTGNGSSQTINCGFAAGARFILIKATSTTGSWWVWDTARGIVSGNDPALQLNLAANEVTSADAIDPASVGFIVNQEATCSINANGVSYIFLAIA